MPERNTVFLWWRGQRSIVENPKVIAAVKAGTIDEDDVWADEHKRNPGLPYHGERYMGPTNIYGAPCVERLERSYKWGPEPWEMVQEVLASDARQILRGPSRKEFELVKATNHQQAQEYVYGQLFAPLRDQRLSDEFVVAEHLIAALGMNLDDLMKISMPPPGAVGRER
jgi:hypothetical protein